MTYTLDSLHPDWLRCDRCGQQFGPEDFAGEDLAALVSLTEDQRIHRWPELAADIELHHEGCLAVSVPMLDERGRFAGSRGEPT
jgi:hypothetical protein